MRKLAPLIFLFLAACATVATLRLDDRFGPADPTHYDHPIAGSAGTPDYWKDVRPVLDQRCVQCHACSDAPCQLNLTSYAGITRGANPDDVYASRLFATAPTRLAIDAQTSAEWRKLGFFPVLNERQASPEANREGGVMYRLLALKQAIPGPVRGQLNDDDLDFSLNRSQTCVPAEGIDEYTRRHPTRGMPFGLPALRADEHQTLSRWIEAGAPYRPAAPLPASIDRQIADWEGFLNGDDNKSRLASRYIYEHWYLGNLWFADLPGQYFELVRSRTPPGRPVDRIATRRPYDDPGVDRVWYRLLYNEATVVAKTHMPLRLDAGLLARLRQNFLAPNYTVASLPGYDPTIAANPFVTFHDLPLQARYRLMLENAQFTLSNYMKGPVCRGQVALNSINDHIWVVFVAPNEKETALMQQLIDGAAPVLGLPGERESTAGLLAWKAYADLERKYLDSKRALIKKLGKAGARPTMNDIWDGDGSNPNAALTVFRHFDSASVERGLLGNRPQTAFVMGYPLLERMHYLLTAGYDVYGNVGHQLATRLYMDFLRMESELNFLVFLPLKDRQAVLDHWYRKRSEPHNRYFADATAHFPEDTGIRYTSKDTLTELYGKVRQRVAPVRESYLDLTSSGLASTELATLQQLNTVSGIPASRMPEASLLYVTPATGKPAIISLIRNSAHTNVAELFDEEERRMPQEDRLIAMNGVVGAYPNAFFTVHGQNLASFAEAVSQLQSPADFKALIDRYGVRRTDQRFWPTSDAIHARWRADRPVDFSILDFSRMENN
jgi:hypothetical protein